MRFLLGALILSCCATGYSQEAPEEVATTEESGSEVANVEVESKNSGCPCGKPSGKPKF